MQKLETKLPNTPGVYFWKKGRVILYIGKATSLKSRVRSYFDKDIPHLRGAYIEAMVAEATSIDYRETDSALEALILEAFLIKKYKPIYNQREKDQKSFNYIVITKETFPRVLVSRERELATFTHKIHATYGPFPSGKELRAGLKIIRRIFPYRDSCTPARESASPASTLRKIGIGKTRRMGTQNRSIGDLQNKRMEVVAGKPCFNRSIGLCSGVCSGEITHTEYKKVIANLERFLQGKKACVLGEFDTEMRRAAKAEEFERAREYRNRLFALKHINDVSMLKDRTEEVRREYSGIRIEAFDIAHTSGTNGVGSMVVIEDGEPNKKEYKRFKLKGVHANKSHDVGNLSEVLTRRLKHSEWRLPDVIVVDGALPQKNAAEKVLRDAQISIAVVSVVKDEKHRPKSLLGEQKIVHDYHREILLANSEAHRFATTYHKKLRDKVN